MPIGIVISSIRVTKMLNGFKLMVVQRFDPADGKRCTRLAAADCVGKQVIMMIGFTARMARALPDIVVDAALAGILDETEIARGL